MEKKFKIPTLGQEEWDGLQASLNSVGRIVHELLEIEDDKNKIKELELIGIHLGLIDIYLGREYSIEELSEIMKDIKFNK